MWGTGNYGDEGGTYGGAVDPDDELLTGKTPGVAPDIGDERDPTRQGLLQQKEAEAAAEKYGRGFALASREDVRAGRARYPFDFVIAGDGDLGITSGVAELTKDLAFNSTEELESLIGNAVSPATRNRATSRGEQALAADPRIESATLETIESSTDGLAVEYHCETVGGETVRGVLPL